MIPLRSAADNFRPRRIFRQRKSLLYDWLWKDNHFAGWDWCQSAATKTRVRISMEACHDPDALGRVVRPGGG